MTKVDIKKVWFPLSLLLVSLLGVVMVLVITRWGAFLSDDSYYYIKPVRDVLAGGRFDPSPMFMPLTSIVLIPLGWLGLEPLVAIRWLNAFLFGANIFLSGMLVRQMGAAKGFALLAACITALSENTLEVHGWAMSEALYITLALLTFYLALTNFQTGRYGWLLSSAVMAGLAGFTRYVGLLLVAAVAIVLLFNRRQAWRLRFRDALLFVGIGLLPWGSYVLRNYTLLGRPLQFTHYSPIPFTYDNFIWYLYTTLSWFIPGRLLRGREPLVAVAIGVLFSAAGVVIWLRRRGKSSGKQPSLLTAGLWMPLVFMLLNYALIFFSRGLNQSAAYNPRYLVPPLALLWLALVYLLGWLWQTGGRAAKVGVGLICVVFLGYYGLRSADLARNLYQTGAGYANIGWHESETVAYLREHPNPALVATGETGIYFWTGLLPLRITAFDTQGAMRAYLCDHQGWLVIMKQMPTDIYQRDQEETIQGLVVAQSFNDSTVYACGP